MAFEKFETYDFPMYGFVRLPEIPISDAERTTAGAKEGCDNAEFLRCLTRVGFKALIPKDKREEYGARAKRELEMFEKLGFVDYVLLVWKITSHCDVSNIARNFGRGSAAGSLVFFLLGITSIDPIKYDLFFERFVSEIRAKKKVVDGITYIDGSLAPDVDIDIEQAKRHEVIEFLKKSYPGRVCKIATLSTLSGKMLIKDCGKIIGDKSDEEMKLVAALIPKVFGVVKDIEDAYKDVPAFRSWCEQNRESYDTALKLRDLIRNRGSHASGYVVSFSPVSEFLPLELANIPDSTEKEIAASLTKDFVANLTIKLDLLGVRCCSVIAEVVAMTGAKISEINIDSDPIIYDNLQYLGCPHGIFQLEAPTNLKVNNEVKPRNLSELSDVVAIARPGALSFLEKYAKRGETAPHPLFAPILESTRNVCLYQEQMMRLSHAVGFTLDEAEQLRRIVGKKKRSEIAAWEVKVAEKVKENGLPEEVGTLLFKILDDSASYSFNKSHSVAYAALAALTTYFKFKYPLQFFTALLKQAKNEPKPLDEIAKIQSELRHFHIELLPPSLLKSDMDFCIEGKNIRFGMSSIKGISEQTIIKLQHFKHAHSNKFELFEAAANAGLSVSVLAALIQSGCLDGVDTKYDCRARLTLEAQYWNILLSKEKEKSLLIGKDYEYDLILTMRAVRAMNNEKGKPIVRESRLETIRKHYKPFATIYSQNKQNSKLARYFYERNFLGYSYSTTLREIFNDPMLMSLAEVENTEDNGKVRFVGVIVDKPYEGLTQEKKNKYARWNIADETGAITCLMFNSDDKDRISDVRATNNDKLPAKDAIVQCVGRRKGDAVFLDGMFSQTAKIYTRFKDAEAAKEKTTNKQNSVDTDTPSE